MADNEEMLEAQRATNVLLDEILTAANVVGICSVVITMTLAVLLGVTCAL